MQPIYCLELTIASLSDLDPDFSEPIQITGDAKVPRQMSDPVVFEQKVIESSFFFIRSGIFSTLTGYVSETSIHALVANPYDFLKTPEKRAVNFFNFGGAFF